MASFGTCNTPTEIALSVVSDGFTISWNGEASTYKMAYKAEASSVWNTQDVTGPGSTGGSGINTDDTGGTITPTAPNASALFSVSGLVPGIYDVRAINICEDGSAYIRKLKVSIEENVGEIPNLRLQSDPGNEFQVNIEWDAPTVDSGNSIIINWCKINRFGQKLDCSNDQVEHDVTKFSILNPGPDITMIWVAQKATNGFQYSVSNPLYILGTPCDDQGCRYVPYTLESESSI